MKTSIATVCISGSLEQKLHACAEAGFDGVEIFEPDLVASDFSPEQIRDLAARLGLTLDLYQPFRDFESVGPELFAANLRRAELKFQLMNRLGIDTMLLCSNVGTATIGDFDVMADQLRQLGDLAVTYNVRVAYEALAWGAIIDDYREAARLVELVNHPAIGNCIDSFHILSKGFDSEALASIPGAKIFFVQMADAPRLNMDVLSWSRHYRVFPGEGQFDLARFMGHLAQTGYDGPISLEIFNDIFRQSDPFQTAEDAMRSLNWLQEVTQGWLAEHASGSVATAAAAKLNFASFTPAVEPERIGFVELRDAEPQRVRNLLTQLGFSDAGRHQTKSSVELWSHGSANIILNATRDGLAGPRVAGIGLDIPNLDQAVERAQQFKAHFVDRKEEAGEVPIRGVFAPDGTELFFEQPAADGSQAWRKEFPQAASAEDALITGFDHVNLTQPVDNFDEAILFFTTIAGLTAQPSLDVPAAIGLVRSQVMKNSSGTVRIPLNLAPKGSTTKRQDYPLHIAFSCTDVRALARAARDRGFRFLEVPTNYYDDIQARFDLTSEFIAELQSLNLLFDRDDRGDFLHFYSEVVGNLFFEVIERQSGYDGYGANNSPIRIAAQYRLFNK
jgi:4-hydroxyphenylpyruvate dioxygenase